MGARWVSFLTWPRGRQALLIALATLLGLAADASLSSRSRAAALLCATAGLCLGAGLAQDAAAAQLDAAEAAEARAYAPEVAAALTRRALPRAIAAFGALAGGAVAGGAAAVLATTPSAPSHARSGAAASPVVAGICLMLAALVTQIYDARSLGREVAIANGTTPPGINASCAAPVRARMGVAAALAFLAVAALLAGAGKVELASLLADGGIAGGAVFALQGLRLAWREHGAREGGALGGWGLCSAPSMGYGSCRPRRGSDGYATRVVAGPFLVAAGRGGAGAAEAEERELHSVVACSPVAACCTPVDEHADD